MHCFLSLAIAVTINFPLVMNYLFGEEGGRYNHGFMVSFTHLGTELLITFIVALLMFTLNFFILKPVERHGKLHIWNIVLAIVPDGDLGFYSEPFFIFH